MSDSQKYMPYAGVGNADAPYKDQTQMTTLATRLESMGYTLRTSGGQGAEEAFEKGAAQKEVHIPWKDFNGRKSEFCKCSKEALELVQFLSPVWDTLKPAVQAIIASKAHLVLGQDLQSPVRFLICWTADGAEAAGNCTARTGFTGTAIKLASKYNIPIFNLKNPDALERLKTYLGS